MEIFFKNILRIYGASFKELTTARMAFVQLTALIMPVFGGYWAATKFALFLFMTFERSNHQYIL